MTDTKSEFQPKSVNFNEDSVTDGSTADIEEDQNDLDNNTRVRKKKMTKKKKIYFRSDFVGDESSSDDDSDGNGGKIRFAIQDMNPSDLSWTMWMWYYLVFVSMGAFHAAEYCGEKLADLFGITAPKYQHAINEYHRLRQEELEEEEAEERERENIRKKQTEILNNLEVGTSCNMEDSQTNILTNPII